MPEAAHTQATDEMDWDDDDPFAALQLEDLASPEDDDASLPETVASSFAVATVTPTTLRVKAANDTAGTGR